MTHPPIPSFLAPQHQAALKWFADRIGTEIAWPKPIDGLFLLNKAKGIHKPAGWQYALSIRQTIDGPYADKDILPDDEGGWSYDYFQEGNDPASRDKDFTNRALMQNLVDRVPVAVVHQVKRRPAPRYNVVGLAYVESWNAGYFRLRSVRWSEGGVADPDAETPSSLIDARRRIERDLRP